MLDNQVNIRKLVHWFGPYLFYSQFFIVWVCRDTGRNFKREFSCVLLTFMPIVPAQCKMRGWDPVLAPPGVIAMYSATEKSEVLQREHLASYNSLSSCLDLNSHSESVASSRGGSRNHWNPPAYAPGWYDLGPVVKLVSLCTSEFHLVCTRLHACLFLILEYWSLSLWFHIGSTD